MIRFRYYFLAFCTASFWGFMVAVFGVTLDLMVEGLAVVVIVACGLLVWVVATRVSELLHGCDDRLTRADLAFIGVSLVAYVLGSLGFTQQVFPMIQKPYEQYIQQDCIAYVEEYVFTTEDFSGIDIQIEMQTFVRLRLSKLSSSYYTDVANRALDGCAERYGVTPPPPQKRGVLPILGTKYQWIN